MPLRVLLANAFVNDFEFLELKVEFGMLKINVNSKIKNEIEDVVPGRRMKIQSSKNALSPVQGCLCSVCSSRPCLCPKCSSGTEHCTTLLHVLLKSSAMLLVRKSASGALFVSSSVILLVRKCFWGPLCHQVSYF